MTQIDFSRYSRRVGNLPRIIDSWLESTLHLRDYGDSFSEFYGLWSAFNSWGLLVTLEKHDSGIVKAIGKSKLCQNLYKEKLDQDKEKLIVGSLESVSTNFPLYSFADLVRYDCEFDWISNQDNSLFQSKVNNTTVKLKHSASLDPYDFESVTNCLYAVRCNLLHGSKAANTQEKNFVSSFLPVLRFITDKENGLFSLGNQRQEELPQAHS
ncbi:hypothetical protein GLF_0966 [Gluconobacter frateurii NBRC 101659]|nr:hypothetical protein GLF_0966 [Gluconobacter frateurii NBRC 101659]